MKKIIFILFIFTTILTSCDDKYSLADRELEVESLPGYVAFNPNGASVVFPDENVDENEGTVELNIEIPTGNLSDITVNYSLSGTAIFGTDFTITGADSTGGQITILHKQSIDPDDSEADNADIVVNILTDNVVDGGKTLTITLDSASNSEGDLAVGRGGTMLLRTATVNIEDVD